MTLSFPDHFSTSAATYARYRPTYPDALIAWVAASAPSRAATWDCGCGSGQATVQLARHFTQVFATDASAEQIARAPAVSNVQWSVATAESSGLADHSVDAITVAQALHWFDLPKFWREVERVGRPGAFFAAWTYGIPEFADAKLTAAVRRFHDDVVGVYWPIERGHVVNRYRDIEMPFPRTTAPPFTFRAGWSLDAFAGYLRSWSAVQRFLADQHRDPVAELEPQLAALWGDGERVVEWEVTVAAAEVVSRKS